MPSAPANPKKNHLQTSKRVTEGSRSTQNESSVLDLFHPVTAKWFRAVFQEPTPPQTPRLARDRPRGIYTHPRTDRHRQNTYRILWCLDKLMLALKRGSRLPIVYISPLKALAVDVERNLRAPLVRHCEHRAKQENMPVHIPEISVRTGDTPQKERARFLRHPGEILITTPESLYLLLTSEAGEALRSVETVIIDEIHSLVD